MDSAVASTTPPEKKGRGGWDKNFLPAEQASEGSCEPACCNAHEML